jgi:1-pyrroline-5-carboxylate dehydrogenase
MLNGIARIPAPVNEPVLSYAPGSPERASLKRRLAEMLGEKLEIPVVVGGRELRTGRTLDQVCPHDHGHVLAVAHQASGAEVEQAIEMPWEARAAVFLKAADLLAGPWRDTVNAATMLGQSKTVYQAEIDAACELVDFWRFNAATSSSRSTEQPISPRHLEPRRVPAARGVRLRVTPFNFTSIAGNLPTAPGADGQHVVWKPASTSILSALLHHQAARGGRLPPGVINFVPGRAARWATRSSPARIRRPALHRLDRDSSRGCGRRSAGNIRATRATRGSSARPAARTSSSRTRRRTPGAGPALVRGAFEYQGQKCSAASRAYVPKSLWPEVEELRARRRGRDGPADRLPQLHGAVIDEASFDNTITGYIEHARGANDAEIVFGGEGDDSDRLFHPADGRARHDPKLQAHARGDLRPVLTIYVYDDGKLDEALELCDTSPLRADRRGLRPGPGAIVKMAKRLRHAAGNFYVNDKPTGAVVGQQPFGGGRASGTNDKAGSLWNLVRWVSMRTIKESFVPPTFMLDPVPRLPFRLVVSGPNRELSAPIEVHELGEGVLELRIPSVVRDSVTVVSGIAPGLDLLPASAATVVSAEALEQRSPQRLVDALESVAGASKLGEGADSVPALRGLARGRTLILIDGARVSAERRAGPSATFVDPSALAAVEVLRGPGSVVYGSDAFGGVLNAVTRDPASARALQLTFEGAAGGEQRIGGALLASAPTGRGALLVQGYAVDAGDADAGGGRRLANSSYATSGGALRYLRPLGRGRLRAALQMDRVTDLGKAASDSDAVRAFYPSEDSDRLVLSWIGAAASSWDALEATLFVGDYRILLDRDRAATPGAARRIDRSATEARDAQARVVGGRALAGGRLQLGLDVHSRFDLAARVSRVDYAADSATPVTESASVAIEDARQVSSGAFATWSRPLAGHWTLAVGARADHVATRNRGGFFGDRSETANALSGNLAATWAPAPGWHVTAQAARGFRVPTLSDRFFRGPSGRGFVVGNPGLEPETATQLDLALRRTAGRTALALYGYRYEIEDLVERYRDGEDFRFRNRGSATLSGIEVELQSRLDESWSLEGGAAWARGRADGGAPLDDQPAPHLFVGARLAEAWGYAFVRVALHGEKDDPGPTELARPGYALLDVGGGRHLLPGVELRLTLRNLLDRRYTGAPDETADRSPGRSVLLALTCEL